MRTMPKPSRSSLTNAPAKNDNVQPVNPSHVLSTVALVLSPTFHRILHKFHLAESDEENDVGSSSS